MRRMMMLLALGMLLSGCKTPVMRTAVDTDDLIVMNVGLLAAQADVLNDRATYYGRRAEAATDAKRREWLHARADAYAATARMLGAASEFMAECHTGRRVDCEPRIGGTQRPAVSVPYWMLPRAP